MRKEPSAPQHPSQLYVLAGFLFAVLFAYLCHKAAVKEYTGEAYGTDDDIKHKRLYKPAVCDPVPADGGGDDARYTRNGG